VIRDPADPGAGTARRVTYLIDPEGTIVRSYPVSHRDIDRHPDQVLGDLRAASR